MKKPFSKLTPFLCRMPESLYFLLCGIGNCFTRYSFFTRIFLSRVYHTRYPSSVWHLFSFCHGDTYCMIHFEKPLTEAMGSIVAGIVLGFLSYRTCSVWMGAALHVIIAISMVFLKLWHQGFL